MKLSTRLHTIFDMVQPWRAADIGYDHACCHRPYTVGKMWTRVCVWCTKGSRCHGHRSHQTIRSAEFHHHKAVWRSAGLEDDVEVVVIAGKGYDTICRILMKGDKQLKHHYKQIILQCNTRVEDMRCWLHQNGFTIDAEQLKRIITIQMLSVHKEPSDMREDQYLFGVYLIGIHYLKSIDIYSGKAENNHTAHTAASWRICSCCWENQTIEKKLKEWTKYRTLLVRL